MEFFNFPKEFQFDRNIPKETIYKVADVDEKLKRIFINNVEKIRINYILNSENTHIESFVEENERYKEIYFLKILLKEKGKENIILKLLHQLIPKATLIISEYEEEILISGALKKIGNDKMTVEEIYNTDWLNKENKKLKDLDCSKLNSANMKFFYESIVEKIRIINLSKDSENIEKEDIGVLETLNKEIEKLKLLRKKETQTNRVVEIQSKLLEKIRERNKILKK